MNAFKALPFWGQMLLTLSLMTGICALGWMVYPNIQEKRAEMDKKRGKLEDLQAQIQEAVNLEKRMQELKREIANLQEQLDQLKTIIPPVRNDSELVQKFEQLAKRSRLNILNITPQRLRQKEFYDEYPIQIQVLANYHDLAKFFDRMAHLQRIFNVGGVKISEQLTRSTTISANFQAVTFIYREESEDGADTGKASKKKKKKSKKKAGAEG